VKNGKGKLLKEDNYSTFEKGDDRKVVFLINFFSRYNSLANNPDF